MIVDVIDDIIEEYSNNYVSVSLNIQDNLRFKRVKFDISLIPEIKKLETVKNVYQMHDDEIVITPKDCNINYKIFTKELCKVLKFPYVFIFLVKLDSGKEGYIYYKWISSRNIVTYGNA